jgi:hypothetical protein
VSVAHDRETDPYGPEVVRRVARRAPLGFGVFLGCVAVSTTFEFLRFPDRRAWMGAFAVGFAALTVMAWALVRRRPAWTLAVLIGFVNAVGVAINVYHALVGAPVAMCVWVLTALLASSAVILPWGRRSQALACLGALSSYPLHLELGTSDPLAWAAGGTYLLAVAALSVFGASLFARYVRKDLQLRDVLSEREQRLQSYFDLSLVGMAIVGPDGRCREVIRPPPAPRRGLPGVRGEAVRPGAPGRGGRDGGARLARTGSLDGPRPHGRATRPAATWVALG